MLSLDSFIRQFGDPVDLKKLSYTLSAEHGIVIHVLYFDSIIDERRLVGTVLTPLEELTELDDPSAIVSRLRRQFTAHGNWRKFDANVMGASLLRGECLLIEQHSGACLAVNIAEWPVRSIDQPEAENSLYGPKDAYVEDLNVNLALLRKRIQDPDLQSKHYIIGQSSRSRVVMLYMKGLAPESSVAAVDGRLSALKTDILLDTSQVVQMVLDKPKWLSPFPLYQMTERPDKAAAALMEGRLLLLVDNSPSGVLLPATMLALQQTPDDYYFPSISGTFLRLVRFVGMLVTLFLPGLYISITSINQEVLRVQFMLAIAASREGVPYPAFIEVFLMMALLEMINEATVRLPKVIGGTATIVGGLIIGTAAAQSHLISNIMIVITAATAIGSFTIPSYMLGMAWRICAYGLCVLAIFWGVYGMTFGMALLLLYLSHLKSLNVPYLAPFNTVFVRDLLRDALVKSPKPWPIMRPAEYRPQSAPSRRMARGKGDEQL